MYTRLGKKKKKKEKREKKRMLWLGRLSPEYRSAYSVRELT